MTSVGNRKVVGALIHLHALTSVHWGAGASLGTVDLPIQRERHTQWPNGAGSALKGVLRDACREALLALDEVKDREQADEDDRIRRLFGSRKTGGEDTNAGAFCPTDVRILAFPVRSLKGVFAWISCPALVARLARDAKLAGIEMPSFDYQTADDIALIADDCPLVVAEEYLQLDDETLKVGTPRITDLARWIAEHCLPVGDDYEATRRRMSRQFVIVPDNVFTGFCKYATEVVARIGLDYNTKTVKPGALFYQELLPAESLMYSLALVNDSRGGGTSRSGSDLLESLKSLLAGAEVLQVGGDETTGKGFCSIHISEATAS